jgi:predicted O-linked N-acetylglucosamine transferase (SPINDLY family)
MRDKISLSSHQDIEAAVDAVGSMQPFYLACQGFNDRELQHIYGDLVCKIMTTRYPQFSNRPIMPQYSFQNPLRVGFVSGYFYRHSNWKMRKGWIENFNKKRLSLYGYYTGKVKDQLTDVARKCFDRFVEDIYSFEELCQIIKNDNLHVLIYPEIGMHPLTVKLAALRLAPIQCTSWGHCDTSGLPTIDYYLSSDLMEPPDANDHYTEKLIRLPNLSIYYSPLDVPHIEITRETFNLRPKSMLYFCAHSLFTHLPQYDDIYPRIAQQVEDCQFLFIKDKSDYLTNQFFQRLKQAFKDFNLDADKYIVLLPCLDAGRYHAINCVADIRLDTIGWSGCNSTFEAIACNLPIVTLPGKLLRQRHSMAILEMMGVTETIASTIDEYIDLAVKLGIDSAWRKYISEKIKNNKHRIYQDKTCITAFEDFLEKVVKKNYQ